jgi:HSP20 family protein
VRDSKNPFVEVELPGVMLEDVELTIEDGELTIHAVRKRGEQTAARKDYAFLERKFGEVTRTIALPGVFGGVLAKTLANGVLTIAVGRQGTHEQLS